MDWERFHFGSAASFSAEMEEKLKRTIVRIDLDQKRTDQPVLDYAYETLAALPEEGLDPAFLVRQLLEVIPNPWQGMRVLDETLDALRQRGMDEERLYANRLDLLKTMKIDLREQVNRAAEDLFRKKLENGDISLKLVLSKSSRLNWALAETLEIDVSDEERVLVRKDGGPLERSLFERVYERDFNNLEKETAWYLDSRQCVYWWHRLAVNQRSYSLQGWQRYKVYPDLLACIREVEEGRFRFSVLETKGEHLRGNLDTEYKRKLFELLTVHAETAIRTGALELQEEAPPITFTMLMEDTWKKELAEAGIAIGG